MSRLKPSSASGSLSEEPAMAFRHLKFAQLPVTDQDRALKFYTEVLGFTVDTDAPYEEGWRWIELIVPGAQTNIVFTKAEASPGVTPGLVFRVDDVNQMHDDLVAKGVAFTQEPKQAPWQPGETFALFKDSEGNTILIGANENER
jgi:lactoylglutathione lyase